MYRVKGAYVRHLIKAWAKRFGIDDWDIRTEKITPGQIEYNGEDYFIGVERDFGSRTAIIYHDIPLCEESIIHELLHIVFPEPNPDETHMDYERWITEAAENINKNEPTATRRKSTKKML